MQLFVLLVVIVILLAFAMSGVSSLLHRLNRWNRVYQGVNKRYCGQLFRGYLFSSPKLWFNYGPTRVVVQNRKTFRYPKKRTTEMWLRWPQHRQLRFEIRDVRTVVKRSVGRNLVEMDAGDAEFDKQFYIATNQPEVLAKLLTSQVLWQVRQLAGLSNIPRLRVTCARGTLKIIKPGWMPQQELLDDFVRFGLELFDRIQLEECEGINFRNENEVTVVEQAICPICSEVILDQMVVCLRCKTPHCLDCWQYNGQCATFACEEKRYVRG